MPSDDFPVQVSIRMPSSHYKRALKVAEQRKVDVSLLISELVRRCMESSRPERARSTYHRLGEADLAQLRRMHAQGATDDAIARVLQCSAPSVGNHRRRLGLAANGRRSAA